MKVQVSLYDFKLLFVVQSLLKEKGGKNPSITRSEIVCQVGFTNQSFSKKLKNLYLKEKQLKELIP